MPFPKIPVSLRWVVLLGFLALALTGFRFRPDLKKSLPDLKMPKVSVSDILIEKTGKDAVMVSLRVTNHNDARLGIKSIACDMSLKAKDKTFALRANTSAFKLKPKRSVKVPVKISGLTADAVSDLVHILWSCTTEGEPVTCALKKGKLKMKVPHLGIVKVSFSSTGTLQPSMQDKAIHYNYNLKGKLKMKVSHLGTVKVPFSSTGALQLSMQGETIHYALKHKQRVNYPDWIPSIVPRKWSFPITDDISINKLIGFRKEISVSDIQIKMTDGLAFDVSLMFPPNSVGRYIKSITCGLSLNMKDKTFALGAATSAFTLEPDGSVVVPIRIPSLTADAASDLAYILWNCIIEGEPVIYALESALTVKVPYWEPMKVPVSCTGPLQLSMKGNAIHYDLGSTLMVNVPHWGPVKMPFSSTGSLNMRGNYELEGTLTVHVPWWGPVKVPISSTK